NDQFAGDNGNDLLKGGDGLDSLFGGNNIDILSGDLGDDMLDGGNGNDCLDGGLNNDMLDGGNGNDYLDGGLNNDSLIGGSGTDQLVGNSGIDTLTGGTEADQFMFTGNLYANGTPALAGQTGIKVLNQPDVITDYTIGQDQFVLDKTATRMDNLVFQKGTAAQLMDGNVLVLQDSFAAAGAAARAIANNNNIQANEGVFVYFNTTLGLSRVVYSKDLGDGGDISVLANLDNQRGSTGLANLANFSAQDFTLG
ncbi:MAG TPA: calcium-binding protein, partial [Allocoleopsis sp.]